MKNALLFGCIVGLLTALFDSLTMLVPDLFIPSFLYPALLLLFNIVLWVVVSCSTAAVVSLFVKKRQDRQALIMLACFAVFIFAYGILGRLTLAKIPQPYDGHVSFLWAACVFGSLFFWEVRKKSLRFLKPVSLIIDSFIVILLYNVCTDLDKNLLVSKAYHGFLSGFVQDYNSYLFCVYTLFTTLTLGIYLLYASRGKRLYRHTARVVFLLAILACSSLFACTVINRTIRTEQNALPQLTPSPDHQKKISNIILIVLDTVRADRLSLLMNNGLAGNLDGFVRDAVVFNNCFAPSPWTFPSHASLFTGLYPSEHGGHYDLGHGNIAFPASLDESFLTLAEIFAQNHYATAAVVSNRGMFIPELGADQGFQIVDRLKGLGCIYSTYEFHPILNVFCEFIRLLPKFTLFYRTAEDINKSLLKALNTLGQSPFFLFINYLDAHEPYRPPRPFNDFYFDTDMPQAYRVKQQFLHLIHKTEKALWDAFLVSQYDGEIAYLDWQLGTFFNELKKRGIYDSSLIIVTSDHGEMLGEHDFYSHKTPLYEEVIKVPLLIKFPYQSQTGSRDSLITLVDLFPTILDICGLPIPENISGKIFGGGRTSLVAEFFHPTTGEHRALRDGHYKYMQYSISKKPELYDLSQDKYEADNLVENLPEIAEAMRKKLAAWEQEHRNRSVSEAVISAEVKEELKALGYIQ